MRQGQDKKMGRIFVHLHSWASGGPYLQQLLTLNKERLVGKGLYYPDAAYEAVTDAHNQQKIINAIIYRNSKKPEFAGAAQKALLTWQNLLENGKDILLSYRPRKLGLSLLSLHSFFDSSPELKKFQVKYFLVLGRKDFAFEELTRAYPWLSQQELLKALGEYDSWPSLIAKVRAVTGPDNSRALLANLQPDQDNTQELAALTNSFFDFISLEPPESLIQPAPALGWRSGQIRQIVNSIDNLWARPDQSELFKELARFEQVCPAPRGSVAAQAVLESLAQAQRPGWVKACQGADLASVWQEAIWSGQIDSKPAFGGFAAAAPATWRYLRDNLYHAPLVLQETGVRILGEKSEPPAMSVLTMAHNQEKYIGECIESVASQKCSFSLEHIIVDDCSSDRTRAIIADYAAKYPHLRPVFPDKVRRGSNVASLFNLCRSKYAALCDGDDYFTDPDKLQKQYEFLEANPDCAICCHSVEVRFEDGKHQNFIYPTREALPGVKKAKYELADLFRSNFIQTNSAVYRWRFRDGLPAWFRPELCPGDWYWHLLHAETGRIGFLPGVMSVYRRHANAHYANAFIAPVEHRRKAGMAELETYKAVNEHFKGQYASSLSDLADGVFAHFLRIQIEEEDATLLNDAAAKYPAFCAHFLESLKKAGKGA